MHHLQPFILIFREVYIMLLIFQFFQSILDDPQEYH